MLVTSLMNTNYLIKSSLERLLRLKEIGLGIWILVSILPLHYFEKNQLEMAQLFHRRRKIGG